LQGIASIAEVSSRALTPNEACKNFLPNRHSSKRARICCSVVELR
jgi:hypothetical protein